MASSVAGREQRVKSYFAAGASNYGVISSLSVEEELMRNQSALHCAEICFV
jgi:hypothetical protein